MPADGHAVHIEFVPRATDVAATVWAECFPAPLEGLFWYQTLEAAGLEDQFRFEYAVIRSGDRAVGIAPCFLHDVPLALVAPAPVAWVLRQLARIFPRVGYQRTLFVGSPCADQGTIGLAGGLALRDVAGPLWTAVRARARIHRAPMVVFKDFIASDLSALTEAGRPGEYVPTVSYPGTVAALPPPGKDAYLRARTHNQRHNLLKKLRRSREVLNLDTRIVTRPSDDELAEIHGLFQQTYERGKTKFERLGIRFFERIREHEPARFIVQRDPADGAMVAFMLVFCLGDRVINKFIGLDYRREGRAFLYFRLFDAALDFAYAREAAELQSGQTGYRAKLDLGHRLVPLHNVFHHANPLLHALFRAVGRRITWRALDHDLDQYLRAHPEQGI